MNKHFTNTVSEVSDSQATPRELELINRHTITPLAADEVFCFTVTLCDNEIDRDLERFSNEALAALEPMFIGKTGIADHSMKSENQTSRIFKTWLETSENEKNSLGESYTALKARAYMPKTPGAHELIAQIKAGIKKETSISCTVVQSLCSICGADIHKKPCKHKKGEIYSGKLCHTVLNKPTDAYEFSFVAVPAQPRAGVTKAFKADDSMTAQEILTKADGFESITLSLSAFAGINEKISRLEALAKDAECYRQGLEKQVLRLAAMAVPALATREFEQICKALSAEQLTTLEKAFAERAAAIYPVAPQLCGHSEKETNNNEFKI